MAEFGHEPTLTTLKIPASERRLLTGHRSSIYLHDRLGRAQWYRIAQSPLETWLELASGEDGETPLWIVRLHSCGNYVRGLNQYFVVRASLDLG